MISEHRQAIRVTDHLVVSWRPANNAQLLSKNVDDITALSVNRELDNLIAGLPDQADTLRKIAQLISYKIDLIADTNRATLYGPSLTRANISTTGMAFDWHTAITAGDQIRLTVTLPPENGRLSLLANVLDCSGLSSSQRYRVRCRFVAGQEQKLTRIHRYVDYLQSFPRTHAVTNISAAAPDSHSRGDLRESLLQYR